MVGPSSQTRGHPYRLFNTRTTRRNLFAKMYGIFYLVLLTFHHWPLLDVPFRILILQIFLNEVCIDLWLCLLFYLLVLSLVFLM